MRIKKVMLLALTVCALLTACQRLDVIGNGSVEAFSKILAASDVDAGWRLTAPDGDAALLWGEGASIELSAKPFIDAGLDPAMAQGGIITLGVEAPPEVGLTPIGAYERIVQTMPSLIEYHDAGGHYMIHVGDSMFEFARDMGTNSKDIVFNIDPTPLIEAGLDTDLLEGWTYTEMETMDGKKAFRLLKIFDLQ